MRRSGGGLGQPQDYPKRRICPLDTHRVQVDGYSFRYKDKVMTAEQILTEVWGEEYSCEYQILRTHIGRLRRKIEDDAADPLFILTESGVGYWLRS